VRKFGKFHYIIHRIEKITLLLAVEMLSKTASTNQDSANAIRVNTF